MPRSNAKFLDDKFDCFKDLRAFVWLGNIFGIRLYFRISTISDLVLPSSLLTDIMIVSANVTRIIVEIVDFIITAFFDKRFIMFFDKLAIYDDKVTKLGNPRRDRMSTYWIVFLLSIAFAVWAIESYSEYTTDETWIDIALSNVKFVIREVTYLFGILKFNLLVHLTYQRFRHLNKTILPSVTWTRELTPKIFKLVTLSDVVLLHATLVDASRIINGIYSIMLLCWFTNLLFTAVMYTYEATYTPWYAGAALSTVLFAEILVTCTVCNSTAEEANNTGKYMSKDKPTLIEDSIAMDRLQMQFYLFNNRVIFSAGDFFEIKLSLLYSMFVSIATYGVLLTSYNEKQTAMNSTTQTT